ncbi:cupin domain-containing protein [Microbaculum sp. FT89]|uniref:cupin domain-containing protein n=1 Tax=Microbaculum sp. FT89 TaxID=3447298 RepID=UPI003F52DE9E
MLIPVRRIITETTAEGRSRILSDGPSPHAVETAPHRGLSNLWVTSSPTPDLSVEDGADQPVVLAPSGGGNIFRFFQLPPAGSLDNDAEGQAAAHDVFEAMGAGSARIANARHPSMHKTDSLDYIILLKGRVKLVLDEDETILEPFDVVIQRQTNHAWENLSPEPALLMAVLLDAPAEA